MGDVTALRESPLAHYEDRLRTTADHPVALREVPFLTMVSVRVDPDSPAATRIGQALGCPLPTDCGETTSSQGHTVVWLGPDEWLVVTGHHQPSVVVALLVAALADGPGSVIDVSANRTVLELRGPSARQVLEKGCPADLHPRVFTPGRAVSTRVGLIVLVLWQTEPDTYWLLPRSSFADYLCRWLLDAMTEYNQATQAGTP
jgi:sarcosine oxidase subunit gamma